MARKRSKKELAAIHSKNNLPHTQHVEMTVKDNKGKVQGKIEVDVFGKKVPKSMMVK